MKNIKDKNNLIKLNLLHDLSTPELKKRLFEIGGLSYQVSFSSITLGACGYRPFFYLANEIIFFLFLISVPYTLSRFILNIKYEKELNLFTSKGVFG